MTARAGGNDTYVQWESLDDNGFSPTLQRLTADGTLNPLITLEPDNDTIQYMYGKLVLRDDNSVFLTHEHIWVQPGSYSNWGTKEIHLTGFAIDGTQTISDIVLMQKIDCVTPYCHFAEPDCAGGGYAYISVAGDTTGNSFKVFSVLIV